MRWLLWLLVLASSTASAQVARPPVAAGLEAELELGFAGRYAAGYWGPAELTISASSPTPLVVELEVTEGGPYRGEVQAIYQLVVAGGGQRKTYLYPYLPERTNPVQLRIYQDGELALEKSWELPTSAPPLVLVVGERLGALAGVLPELAGRVAQVRPSTLPPDPLGYDGVRALLLSDYLGPLGSGVTGWVRSGGHLIVALGEDALAIDSGLAALLPVTVEAVGSRDQLFGQAVESFAASVARAKAGAAARYDHGWLWIATIPQGAGQVSYVGFDPLRPPAARWPGAALVLQELLALDIPEPDLVPLARKIGAYHRLDTGRSKLLAVLAVAGYVALVAALTALLRGKSLSHWGWLGGLVMAATVLALGGAGKGESRFTVWLGAARSGEPWAHAAQLTSYVSLAGGTGQFPYPSRLALPPRSSSGQVAGHYRFAVQDGQMSFHVGPWEQRQVVAPALLPLAWAWQRRGSQIVLDGSAALSQVVLVEAGGYFRLGQLLPGVPVTLGEAQGREEAQRNWPSADDGLTPALYGERWAQLEELGVARARLYARDQQGVYWEVWAP
ncbi:MAG: hypothetical protein HY335_00110 [Deinococcus sp.]|nr:hypothetical protein [Deinococcus sp.]